MSHQQTQDSIPGVLLSEEVADNVAAQIAGAMATELTIFVDPANSPEQGGNDGESVINIEQAGENTPIHETVVLLIARAIKAAGVITMAAAGGMAFSKPAHDHNNVPYYVTLAVIFSFGVAEFFTGIWISMSSLTYWRRLWIGGIVLFLCIWPLIGMHMGGFA